MAVGPKITKTLFLILILSAILRLYRLDFPKAYVFDEVYHGFTAKEYLLGHRAAWEWLTIPPPGVAYEWTHPPLAKEIMASSMWVLHNTDPVSWRIPGALLGILSVYLVYLISLKIFNNQTISLLSAFIFSLDGLNFVQSRVGMNDIYLVTFSLASLLFFLNKKLWWSTIFLGLAISSKWTGAYMMVMLIILTVKDRQFKNILPLIFIPAIVYFLSYIPFFLLGHSLEQFVELQRQMFYYHSHLRAHHDYSSPWWSWPLNLYPVWYYVEYSKTSISNIFASGNPIVFWAGLVAAIYSIYQLLIKKTKQLLVPLLGYLIFLLPWSLSPRIMFLYHYCPSLPFLSMILGYQLNRTKQDRSLFILLIGLIIVGFLAVYPYLTGIPLPKNITGLFFHLNLAKNPFGR